MKTTRYEINVALPRAIGSTRKRRLAHYFRVLMYDGASSVAARDVADAMALSFPGATVDIVETETDSRIIP